MKDFKLYHTTEYVYANGKVQQFNDYLGVIQAKNLLSATKKGIVLAKKMKLPIGVYYGRGDDYTRKFIKAKEVETE